MVVNRISKMFFLSVLSIIFLCFSVTIKEIQNDTFYIIKLGEFIFEHGVDLIDHYCWITDLSYTYPHWLYDLFMYIIYANFDYIGIYVSTIVLFILLILSVYVINLRFNKNSFIALLISIVSASCLVPFVAARAQLVSIILFLWQIYFMEKLIKFGRKKYMFSLIFISGLIANIHATIWLFCFVLYLPFLVEHLIYCIISSEKLKNKFNFLLNNKKILISEVSNIKNLVLTFLLSFVVGIFTPSKICYSYIFKVMMGNSQNYILEHAPLIITEHICFMVFIFVGLLILIFTNTKIKLRELFMISGILLMSLLSFRHIIFFYTIALFYLSIFCNRYLNDSNDVTLSILQNLILDNNFVYFGFIIIILVASLFKFQTNYKESYVPVDKYPVKAVKYIKNNLNITEVKLYNNYNFGSYLLFNDIPVFIDSRCDLYLKEFNGLDYSIFDDSVKIEYIYEKKFKKYGVTHALLYKDEIFSKILIKDSNYNIIYEDKYFILFEKVV